MLTSQGLSSVSTCVLKAEPGKLDIKRRGPGILFISLPIVERHHDLIKATCREIDNVYQATRNNTVNMRGN